MMSTVGELKTQLESRYDLKSFIDLATLTSTPQAAYQFFNQHHQIEYKTNDRLVLYTSETVSLDLIAHLYKAANLIDVSNYFILVCSPTDISQRIHDSLQFSTDPVPFRNLVVNIENTQPLDNQFILSNTICPLPWMHSHSDVQGNLSACCTHTIKIGSIKKDNIIDIFDGDYMQKLRHDLAQGKQPAGCSHCWNKEAFGLSSIRDYAITNFMKDFLIKYIDQPAIASLDLNLNNTCNFKCRICDGGSSSLIAQEDAKIKKIPIATSDPWSTSDDFLNQIQNLLPTLKNIDLYGGEPFLNKELGKLLKQAVDIGVAGDIRLHFNSNGSIYPDHMIQYWSYFKKIDLHFSIDAIGSRFELERGGSWNAVEQNILRIKNLNLSNCNINVYITIGAMNILYIDEVLDWANSHGFSVRSNYVDNPEFFSLSALTKTAKQLIIEKHKHNPWPEMKHLLLTIGALPDGDGKTFIEKNHYFDSIRNQKFVNSHKEIAVAMGYSV